MVKNPPANAGDLRDVGLIPGLGRFPGEGNGNILQYSCLESPMDRGALVGCGPQARKELDTTEATSLKSTAAHRQNSKLWCLDAQMLSIHPHLWKELDGATLVTQGVHCLYKGCLQNMVKALFTPFISFIKLKILLEFLLFSKKGTKVGLL